MDRRAKNRLSLGLDSNSIPSKDIISSFIETEEEKSKYYDKTIYVSFQWVNLERCELLHFTSKEHFDLCLDLLRKYCDLNSSSVVCNYFAVDAGQYDSFCEKFNKSKTTDLIKSEVDYVYDDFFTVFDLEGQ